jgi:uncharacterized integral membrane protein
MDQGTDHEHEQPPPPETAPPASVPPAPTSTPTPTAPTPAPEEVPPHVHEPEGRRWAFWAKLAALLFFVGYAIAFVVGNDKTISVDFVFATSRVSLIWTILLLLVVGVLAGALFGHLYRRHGRKKVRKA